MLQRFFKKIVFYFSGFKDFSLRSDTRREWSKLFPQQGKQVDIFLSVLDQAFIVPKRYQFRILPQDTLLELYKRSTYLSIDSMQIETMVLEIEKYFEYRLNDKELSFEISVKELFIKITQKVTK